MTPRQIQLVQDSWSHIEPVADHAARLFYLRLFDEQPEIRDGFKTSVSGQEGQLAEALNATVKRLSEGAGEGCEELPELNTLSEFHSLNGICAERYEQVADALFWMLEQELGSSLDNETLTAWREVYSELGNRILGKELAIA